MSDKNKMVFSEHPKLQLNLGPGGGRTVQSDWNQNDPTKPDHIKNRLAYYCRKFDDIEVVERLEPIIATLTNEEGSPTPLMIKFSDLPEKTKPTEIVKELIGLCFDGEEILFDDPETFPPDLSTTLTHKEFLDEKGHLIGASLDMMGEIFVIAVNTDDVVWHYPYVYEDDGNIIEKTLSIYFPEKGMYGYIMHTEYDESGTIVRYYTFDKFLFKYVERLNKDFIPKDYVTSDEIPSIPTRLSELNDDETHRTVTDSEKESWNVKPTNEDFDQFKIEILGRNVTEELTPKVENGFYAPTMEGSNKIGFNSSNYHCIVNAQAGEIYTIKTRCGSALRAYLITDFDGNILDMSEKEAWSTVHNYDIELKIEKNCNLIINAISSDEIGLKRTKTINKFIVNKLTGKTIACEGDSIMFGAGHSGGFAKIIADRNGMLLTNNAISGGTLASETYRNGVARHWISSSFENLPVTDYIIFNGGVNDRSLSVNGEGDPKIGEMSEGYDATLDLTTTLGGLEHCCKLLRSKYVTCKSGFVFPHRIWGYNDHWDNKYRVKMKEILEKWGVPYLDLSDIAPPLNRIAELKATYTSSGDGWHPNELGYKLFYCDVIEEWLKTL